MKSFGGDLFFVMCLYNFRFLLALVLISKFKITDRNITVCIFAWHSQKQLIGPESYFTQILLNTLIHCHLWLGIKVVIFNTIMILWHRSWSQWVHDKRDYSAIATQQLNTQFAWLDFAAVLSHMLCILVHDWSIWLFSFTSLNQRGCFEFWVKLPAVFNL